MKLTIPYQVILEKMNTQAFEGVIETHRMKYFLRYIFRMPKDKIKDIFNEMRELGLIEFENCRSVKILWKPEV